MYTRTLGGIVLAQLGERSTIRLETGETRVVTVPCLSRIGDKVHVYIDRSLNKVIKVDTADCPDHWDGDVEPEPVCIPDEIEDIPRLQFLIDREVLGRQGGEETRSQEFQESQEVLGRPGSEGEESMLDDVFQEDYLTQVGDPSHKF